MILHHPTRALHSCTILRQIAQFAQKDWQNLLNFFSKIFHTCCEFCAREWYTSIHERRGEWRSLQTENRRVRDMTNDKDTKDAASAAATKKPSASAVEALIAKAKERSQAAAPGKTDPEAQKRLDAIKAKQAEADKARKEAREEREKLREANKAKRKTQQDEKLTKRAEKKAASEEKRKQRMEAREAKKAAKSKKPVTLSDAAQAVLDSARALPLSDLTALTSALNRATKDRAATDAGAMADKPEAGDRVEITSGEHAGKAGQVTRVQRVRCFVKLDGDAEDKRPTYLYVSQVRVLEESSAKKAKKSADASPATPAA